jgi:hypothetical protein
MAFLSSVAIGLVAALALVLMYSTLAPKGRLTIYLALASVVPLLLLWLYLFGAYRTHSWWLFGHDSLVPHVLAALGFLAVTVGALVNVSGSLSTKTTIGVLISTLWGVIWFNGTLLVACAMGDCL